jgi:16S rRNA (guanine527-N7)-methyltransferase
MRPTDDQGREGSARSLHEGLDALGLPATTAQTATLLDYLDLLQRWNKRFNLTAVRDPAQMIARHLLDCLAALPSIDRWAHGRALRVCDVGSGGGLPGLVWAVMRPQWRVTCIDAVAKKAAFVGQAAGELAIVNLCSLHSRVESYRPAETVDLVASRAFAALADFVRLSRHLVGADGAWLAMKGADPAAEMATLPKGIDVFHVEQLRVPGIEAQRCLVWMRAA